MVEKKDYRRVAELHIEGIPEGFLSSLGVGFLSKLYESVDSHKDSVLFLERDAGSSVVAFLAGTLSLPRFYRYALRRYGFSFIIAISSKLFSIVTLKKIIETVAYPFVSHSPKPSTNTFQCKGIDAELLSVAVTPEMHGRGLGKKLVGRLDSFFKEKGGIKEYKVVTSALDNKSNAFYRSAGFVLLREFIHHGKRMNEYRKSLT